MTTEPVKVKDALKGKMTTFRSQHWDERKGVMVETLHVVSKDIFLSECAKAAKKGYVVLFREPDGSSTGYEFDERRRYKFPNHGTKKQTREPVKRFPWEGK